MPSVREVLAAATQRLAEAGVPDGEREAGWMLAYLLDTSAGSLRLRGDLRLMPDIARAFADMVQRRAGREPLQYILGTEEFLGLTFKVTPAVLIPRLDTEVLVREAVTRLSGRGPVRVADIGTGSGAIAVGVAHLLPDAAVVAVDLSEAALAVARENAEANDVAERVAFLQGDLMAPLGDQRCDAILSNPPYIGADEMAELMPEVRDWEPHLALSPGTDAYRIYRRLAEEAHAFLKPGALLGVEAGIGQALIIAEFFRQAGFLNVTIHQDTAGIDRAVFGYCGRDL